ncbi:MAG: hypothetical protein PVH47_07365 [Thiohalocapsa sp.]|jgi:hypothetical protein
MKVCTSCHRSKLPYILVTLIAAIIGFITWLTLGLSTYEPMVRLAGGLVVFAAVAATLLHYVFSCIQRHCRHQHDLGHTSSPPHAT